MRRCSNECYPICDFCHHYKFNGQPIHGLDDETATVYTGEGWCQHPDHPHEADPCDDCHDFYCSIQAKADAKENQRMSLLEALTVELAQAWDAGPIDGANTQEMRVDSGRRGADLRRDMVKNPRVSAHRRKRHSREYSRQQRVRYIAKRLGYYPWHTAPAGMLAKWSGGPSKRQRKAERCWEYDRRRRMPKYPHKELEVA